MQLGRNITAKDDLLQEISISEFYRQIKSPSEEIKNLIARLRLVRTVDPKQYGILKRSLPYIVCGTFNPSYRRIDNFGYTEYFMADIDHASEKLLSIDTLKDKLIKDSRVVMCFISPSEDGLKVLFRLAEKCYDAGKYSLFYKLFLKTFSQQFDLEQVVDSRTSDVSRACFLSYDSDVYFNPDADAVNMEDFVNFDNPLEIKDLQRVLKKEEVPESNIAIEKQKDPDADTLAFIKQKLANKKAILRQKPQMYVPEQLEQILENLTDYIKESGVVVEDIENISYGKKFKLRAGLSQGEINLFFGKRGFSVVKSPRQGTSDQLNELMKEYIQAFINDYILLKESVALTYESHKIKADIPEHELMKQQAQLLFTDKNWRETLPIYQTLWENYADKCNEWDGWRYAYSAQKLGKHNECLDICRKVYLRYRDFKIIRNVYAWSIYYLEIKKEKIADEDTFFKAANAILKLVEQADIYSPYILTVFKVVDYLNEKVNTPFDKILDWTSRLNSNLLDKSCFSFIDKENKTRETASKYEQYYMFRTRALLEKGRWEECIQQAEEALQTIDKLHYDNDIWFRWRIALAYEGMGEWEKSLNLQLKLLDRKKEWFIQKEIAEQYYRMGDYEKALKYALDSVLNSGEADKKINAYIVLANTLEKTGDAENAKLQRALIDKINRKGDFNDDILHLSKLWNELKFRGQKRCSGIIHSLLPNGKAGFVKGNDGRSYYFQVRSFKEVANKATVGMPVTYYLEEGFDAKKNKKTLNAVELKHKN